jgi:UDP-4-amino-4-deoxy-L-arabinose-oxoglutarate aminotransferase
MPKIAEKRDLREALVRRYEARLREAVPAFATPGATASPHGVPWLVERRGVSSHHLFTLQVPPAARDALLTRLGAEGIGTAVNYRAIHTLTYLVERLHVPTGALPVAEEIGDRTLSLPLYPTLTEAEQDRVVDAVARSLRELCPDLRPAL